jgi:hypothetical protein
MLERRKFVIMKLIFSICLILNACTGIATAVATTELPIQTPATSIKEVLPTINFLATKYLTPSPYIRPSTQVSLTFTSTPSPSTVMQTSVPANTIRPKNQRATMTEQAFDLLSTNVASFSPACKASDFRVPSLSPSGNWLAITCGYAHDQTLEVDGKEGKRWILQLADYVPEDLVENGKFITYGALLTAHWTNDETYLFFKPSIGFDGGGTCFYSFGAGGLFRLNLINGTVTTTLSKSNWGGGYDIAFSPTGRKMAYAYNSGQPIIFDLNTGEKDTIEVGDNSIGHLTWSPDGLELAYAACHANREGVEENSSVRIFSLVSHTTKTILNVGRNILRIQQLDGHHFQIEIYDVQANKTEILIYDWFSGQLATPSPEPE